ncbi:MULTISPECIES: hypothetical protein [Stenotrophomonas]|uniref:hypothetical protein n=1 Tax=Stenotrophomonas TaxID=40323 RepID=UPI002E7843F7|nr:hypothetical protein [Stenotrophomonas geniculata]
MVKVNVSLPFHQRGTGMSVDRFPPAFHLGRRRCKSLAEAEAALRAHRPRSIVQCEDERKACHNKLAADALRHRIERRIIRGFVALLSLGMLIVATSGVLRDTQSLVAAVLSLGIATLWLLVDISGYRLAGLSDEELGGLAGLLTETWMLDDVQARKAYQICLRHPDVAAVRTSWSQVNPRLTMREFRILCDVDDYRRSSVNAEP